MADYSIAIKIAGKLEKSFSNALSGAQRGLGGLAGITGKMGKAVVKATAGSLTTAATALTSIGAASIKVGKEFETAMSSAAATAAATPAQYAQMEEAARNAAKISTMTASQAAAGLEYMALAGWDVNTSCKALPSVLKMAEASGMELATCSDLVTDSMSALGVTVEGLPNYLDIATKAQTKSNQTAQQMMEAYIGVGGSLANLNVPLEESGAILGVLANRGVKGAEAGTALNAVLSRITAPTGKAAKAMAALGVSAFDSTGKFKGLDATFKELNTALQGCTEEQRNMYLAQIAGTSHISDLNAIMAGYNTTLADGSTEVEALTRELNNCNGALDRMRAMKVNNLEGDIALIKSALEDLGISIYKNMQGPLREFTKFGSNALVNIANAFTRGGWDEMFTSIGNIIANGLPQALDLGTDLIDKSATLVEQVCIGIEQNAPKIGESAAKLIAKLGEAFIRVAPRLVVVGAKLIVEIGKGLIQHAPELIDAAKEAFGILIKGLGEAFSGDGTSGFMKAIPIIGGAIAAFGALQGVAGKISGLFGKLGKGAGGGGLLGGITKMLFGKGGGLNIGATLKTIGSVSLIVGAIAGLSTLFGWLNNNIAGFKENLKAGAEVAGLIGEFIGSFVGGAIGGAVGTATEVITSKLPAIADSLTAFAQKMQPFFNTISGMNTGQMTAFAQSLTQMLLVVAGNELLTALNKFLGNGDALGQFATKLSSFADQIQPVFNKLATLNTAGVENAPKVFGALGAIGNVAFNSGGMLQGLIGELDLAGVAEGLSAFADTALPAFDDFATINTAGIENVPKVFEGLSKIGGYEFKSGGLAQVFSGDVDLAGIGEQLSAFGETALPAIGKFADLNSAGIDNIPKVFEGLSKIGGYEFKSGGLAQLFTGSTDITNVGEQLAAFGETALPAIGKFADLNPAGVDNIPRLFEGLSKIGGYEFKSGGFAQLFSGSVDLSGLGTQLSNFASSSKSFFDLVGTMDTGSMSNVTQIFDTLESVGQSATGGGLAQLKSADLGGIAEPLTSLVDGLIPFFQKAATIDAGVFSSVKQMFASLQEVGTLVSTANLSGGNLAAFGEELVQFVDAFAQFSAKLGTVEGGAGGITSFVSSLTTLSNGLSQVSGGVTQSASAIRTELTGLTSAISAMQTAGTADFSGLATGASNSMTQMSTAVQTGTNQMRSSFTSSMSQMRSSATSAMSGLVTAIRAGMNNAANAARSGAQGIANAFRNINLSSAGAQMMRGLVNGINNMRGTVVNAARSVASAASNAVNSALKIHSPSRLMIESGQFVGEGLALGMRSERPAVQDAAGYMARPVLEMPVGPREGTTDRSSVRSLLSTFGSRGRMREDTGGGSSSPQYVYSPTININGNGVSGKDVQDALAIDKRTFERWLREHERKASRVALA